MAKIVAVLFLALFAMSILATTVLATNGKHHHSVSRVLFWLNFPTFCKYLHSNTIVLKWYFFYLWQIVICDFRKSTDQGAWTLHVSISSFILMFYFELRESKHLIFIFYPQILDYVCTCCIKPECQPQCTRRCSKTQYHKPCMFFCQKCCNKCLCVPPGFYGNKSVCPCYNNWKTKEGGPKCPWFSTIFFICL